MLSRKLVFIFILLLAIANPASAIKYKGDLEANESLTLPEQSAKPANPSSGKHKLYFKDDGAPYSLDPSGNENPINRAGIKNYLINGGFRLWQRGTSFTTMDSYGADRWKHGSPGTATVSRQEFTLGQTDVPGEPEFYWRNDTTVAGVGTATLFRQRIEDVRTLAGQTVTLSFWAKADASKIFQVVIQQVFGTGGSPSADIIALNQSQPIETAWTRYTYTVTIPSISGKTLGTNDDDYLEILIQETSGFSTFTLDVAQIQLEKGAVAIAFGYRPIGLELRLAQRYYCKTYAQGTDPGTATPSGIVTAGFNGVSLSPRQIRTNWVFPVTMRAAPSITFYDQFGTSSSWEDGNGGGATVVVLANTSSDNSVNIAVDTASLADARILGHIVADAEL